MIFVTGGTGLVGSHLLYKLASEGHTVRALCRTSSCLDDIRKLFEFYSGEHLINHIEWFEGDLLDYFSLRDALKGITQVYHCAAMVSFKPSDADEMFTTNVDGTANLVNASIDSGIDKFCFVSSIATLGSTTNGEAIDESTFWQNDDNHSVYSQSKFQSEMEVWRGTKEGLKAVIVNPSVIIGPVSMDRSSGQLFKTVQNGMLFYTMGATGFVDVRDVVDTMIKLTNSDTENERFVINGENLSYKSFLSLVAEALKVKAPKFRANRWLVSLAWRYERLRYYLSRKEPRLTKETARTSQHQSVYSCSKLKNHLPIEYFTIKTSVSNTVKYMQG